MSHSAEEKIKILYEDSLTEIRDLASRMEGVRTSLNDVEAGIKKTLNSLPSAADKEMKRAADTAIGVMAGQVAGIATKIAGDAASAEKDMARLKAILAAGIVILTTGILFYSAGYSYANSAAKNQINDAKIALTAADLRVDQKIAELVKESDAEIAKIRAAAGWAGTPDGKLARDFFVNGSGLYAAKCKGKTWDIKESAADGSSWCIPQSKPIFGGGSAEVYGWKIPSGQ